MKWVVALLAIWAAWTWLRPRRAKPQPSAEAEARGVLGVDAAAGDEAIRAAHRRLIAGVHPDRGGSADLTRRVNAARDLLLRGGPRG
ncbi:J domain-containing protein [Sphingomonas sp. CROZ-RG-20F-R02-07]|uniref:J domain-containing protein n=1 Tax=Sphingomonas sp. CROZ-RG-20F-R02-07 TaxID=2914832 RepID=UPI001F5A1988